MKPSSKWFVGFLGAVAGLLILAMTAPNYSRGKYVRVLKNAETNLLGLIEAEDRYYQRTGEYLPLEFPPESKAQELLGWRVNGTENCAYAVTVSGQAFTAEVRCTTEEYGDNYLGYVRSAPGKLTGVDGKFGKCTAEGIHGGSRKLVNTIGPSIPDGWQTMSVGSGSKRSLAIETLPSGAAITINGRELGESTSFHGTISSSYGYFYMDAPPASPVAVVVTKEGYMPVSFSVEWDGHTYQAAIPLRPKQNK